MSSVRRFLFDESFDVDGPPRPRTSHAAPPPEPEPPHEPEPPPPPPPPTFSEAELAAARQAGFKEGEKAGHSAGYGKGFGEGHVAGRKDGYEAGKTEIMAKVEARLAAAVEAVAGGINQMLAERARANAVRQDEPVHLALAMVRKLMPELARSGGLAEIEGVVRACMTEMIDEPRFIVRVAPDMADPVRETLEGMAASRGFTARLVVVDEPALARGDCRIEWAEGGAERDTARLMADIETCVGRLLTAPAPV